MSKNKITEIELEEESMEIFKLQIKALELKLDQADVKWKIELLRIKQEFNDLVKLPEFRVVEVNNK